MPTWFNQDLHFEVDAGLRGQGADPGSFQVRSPRLVDLAERALEERHALIEPKTQYRQLEVEAHASNE